MADDTNPQKRPVVTRSEARSADSKRYFTGRPCRHGHIGERLVSNGSCLICSYARDATCRAENPRETRDKDARYRAASREKRRICCAAWRKANPEKARASVLAWTAANTDRINARRKVWRSLNREKFSARYAVYMAANQEKRRDREAAIRAAQPEKHRAFNANRRARKRQGKCAHPRCRKRISNGYHIDHIIPLAIGGSNDRRNLQLLCRQCNLSKHTTHPIDLARRNGMLL